MQKCTLGQDGLEVSAIGPGCMGMSSGYGPAGDRQEMITLVPNRHGADVRFFDTAEVYSPFVKKEPVVRRWLFRGKVVMATKFGFAYDGNGEQVGLSIRF